MPSLLIWRLLSAAALCAVGLCVGLHQRQARDCPHHRAAYGWIAWILVLICFGGTFLLLSPSFS